MPVIPAASRWLPLAVAGALLAACVSDVPAPGDRAGPAGQPAAPGAPTEGAVNEDRGAALLFLAGRSSVIRIGTPGAAEYHAELAYADGFHSSRADLWVRGLPPGVEAWFERDPLTHPGRSVLRVRTSGETRPGTYPLVLGATAAGASASVRVPLVITARPGFALRPVPAFQSVPSGDATGFRVLVRAMNGFRGALRWRVTGAPAGARAWVERIDGRTFAVGVRTSPSTPAGTHVLRVQAAGGDAFAAAPVALRVVGTASSWRTANVGSTGRRNNTARVGAARNDGVRRVYAGTVTDGRIYEFSRTRSGWRRALVGTSMSEREIHNMTIGPGRNDGRNRIYACSIDGYLHEFTHRSSGWARQTIGTRSDGCFHAVVGRGRGDSRNRLYAARDNEVWEYTRTASGWRAVRVGRVAPDGSGVIAHGIEMGKGRNDGRIRLYVASDGAGAFEATFTSNGWRMRHMGDTGDVRNVSVGAGRNDGRQRVYAGVLDGREGYIREFTWRNGDWVARSIGADHPINGAMVHAYVINGRNDGRRRVYGAGGDGYVYEFTWTGSGWRRRLVGGGGQYMYGFHFGKRANRMRLYGADFGDQVYEFTWR